MDKITFQDGTRVSRAKVTINGVDYIVTPAEFTGSTPMSAYVFNLMQTNIENAINQNADNIGGENYDNTKTYALGDIVIYQGQLYVCTTAISIAEDFDSTKWTAINLIEIIDNLEPLPVGGTQGQVLTKNSSQDGDASWQTPSGGGGSSDLIIVGDESEITANTKLLIENNDILPAQSEVVNSLDGNQTTKAPSVKAVKDRLKYSTTEQVVGEWIDGKPLYRRVFSQNNKNNIDINSLDYDYITIVYSIIIIASGSGDYVRNPYYTGSSDYFRTLIIPSGALQIETSHSTIKNWTTVLEYTKTTD